MGRLHSHLRRGGPGRGSGMVEWGSPGVCSLFQQDTCHLVCMSAPITLGIGFPKEEGGGKKARMAGLTMEKLPR